MSKKEKMYAVYQLILIQATMNSSGYCLKEPENCFGNFENKQDAENWINTNAKEGAQYIILEIYI